MDRQILKFTANEQVLTVDEPIRISTNKVNYIEAHFALGTNWSGYDSVRAVWFNDYQTISTVLDSQGVCRVPFEVMKRKGQVKVDLVGSISENDVLTDRLTSYPVVAVVVDCVAPITGAETSPITPSQFEQYVAIVQALVGSVRDIDRIELNPDYTLTIYYSDGTSDTTSSIRGATGNGIASIAKTGSSGTNPVVDTYTVTYTGGNTFAFTVTNGKKGDTGATGATGPTGNGIQSIYKTGTSGLVDTYTILYTNGNTTTFEVTNGQNGSLASTVLASTYSSSKTYAVGDYVYYSGNLYRCTTAITTAEAWTSGHWTQVALADDVSDLKSDLNMGFDNITNYGERVVNKNNFEHYYVNNGYFDANADSLMGIIPMENGATYNIFAVGTHNRFRIYVTNTLALLSQPTEVYRSEPVHTVTGDSYTYTNTSNYTYLLCFMNYLTEQSMTFSVTESFGDETEPFTVNGIELYTKEQTDEAIENAVEGITSYRNIFNGVYVSQYPGIGGAIVDTDNARSARFNVKPNYTYHIHAVGNTNRFIVYGGQNGVFTEITRIQTADVTGDDELSVTNTNYSEFLVMLYFGTGGSSFACSTTVYESQTAELHFSVNGTLVYTAEETDELLDNFKTETSEEIRDNSAEKYIYSKNLYDISDSIGGYSIASATGELVALPSARSSNFIEILPNAKYAFSTKHVVAWYDENKVFVSGVPSSDTNLTLTSPASAKYLRFSHQILTNEVMVNEGETALPYQPYDFCLQPEYLPPIKKYALDFSTVKYTESLTVSMNNLMLMAYKMVFGSFPNYQGFLLLDGTTNKFYYADSNFENIAFVFDWNMTLANNVSPQDYLCTITADGDVIFLRKWKRENPIIYPNTDYTNPVRVDFGNNPAPYGFLESISCVQFDDGSFVFGEYAKHSLTDEQNNDRRNIWRVTKPYTNVANWTIAHSFKHVFYESPVSDEPNNEIGHIHTVVYDFYADILYCSTGDIDRHCRVWASEDKGITWAEVASNGQKYRALGMTFTDDSAYWATDSFNANHNLWKVDRDANGELDFDTLTMLCSLEPSSRRSGSQATTGSQATYGMILMREPYGILMLERAEPRPDNKLDILFYSLEDGELYTVATLGKADDLASLVEPNRNGLCNQCFTDYQPDTCGYALTGGGQMVRPNTTDILHNSATNYIGVLKLKVIEQVNQ